MTAAAVLLMAAVPIGIAAQSARAAPAAATLKAFLDTLWPEAEARGVSRPTFDTAFAGLTPDPSVTALTRRQPELLKPTGAYLAAQVTAARVAKGSALVARWHDDLAEIARRYGVPPEIVVAVWGLETNYGASPGDKDVIRSMATLAAAGTRTELYRDELVAALLLLQAGDASRAELRGSWAGAMGQPQFMPSSFAKYAVDFDRDGRRDIWGSVPDALASIANFLHEQGWRSGEPWGIEVRLPPGFDLSGPGRLPFADWAARHVATVSGAPMPDAGEGILYFPAGASGPAFLATANFEVVKTYNFSDNYVLGVGTLADRIAGRPGVAAAWPIDPPISRADRIALQARLAAMGYPVDNREGRISLALRDTIRAAQRDIGAVPDGNPTAALLRALDRMPTKR